MSDDIKSKRSVSQNIFAANNMIPIVEKDKVLIICSVDVDGEIKENKPLYLPTLDWVKDLKMSVIGPKDVKVLHNSII